MDAFVARELRGHSAQGQTVPLYLACRVGSEEVVYQTKLSGRRSGLSPRELGVELLGTTLAQVAGLHVARPAMVTLPPKILADVERGYAFGIDDQTAFGVVWKPFLTPFLPDVETAQIAEDEAATLLALDLLLTNGDRTEPNPNVCWDRERLLVFDFEHCLELPSVDPVRRLAIHLESLGPLWETHLVAPWVGREALRSAMVRLLAVLPLSALRRDAFALPLSWFNDFIENVEYLESLRDEPEPLLRRIERLVP